MAGCIPTRECFPFDRSCFPKKNSRPKEPSQFDFPCSKNEADAIARHVEPLPLVLPIISQTLRFPVPRNPWPGRKCCVTIPLAIWNFPDYVVLPLIFLYDRGMLRWRIG